VGWARPACDRWGGVGLAGPVVLMGHRARVRAVSGRLFSCRAGSALWAENEAQPSPTSCSCQPRPEKIVLGPCSCRAKKSCFGPAHGPRAKWPSIGRTKLSQKAPYKVYHINECYEREMSRINRLERQDEMRVHEQDARRFKFVNLV
jgi:hypothetical protein